MILDVLKDWIPLVIGVIGSCFGAVAWYRGAVEKRYAAQRDFAHLRENQKQISSSVNDLFKEQDRRFDTLEKDISELKMLMHNSFMHQTGESISAILRKRHEE